MRLEIPHHCPDEVAAFLLQKAQLGTESLHRVKGPVNVHRLAALCDAERPDLKYPSFTPSVPKRLSKGTSLFDEIRRGDVLLHHPYDSFAPVVDFVREAAVDPDVPAGPPRPEGWHDPECVKVAGRDATQVVHRLP